MYRSRPAAGLLAVSSVLAAVAVAPDPGITAPTLMCVTLFVLSSLVAPTTNEILVVAAADIVVATVGGYLGRQENNKRRWRGARFSRSAPLARQLPGTVHALGQLGERSRVGGRVALPELLDSLPTTPTSG